MACIAASHGTLRLGEGIRWRGVIGRDEMMATPRRGIGFCGLIAEKPSVRNIIKIAARASATIVGVGARERPRARPAAARALGLGARPTPPAAICDRRPAMARLSPPRRAVRRGGKRQMLSSLPKLAAAAAWHGHVTVAYRQWRGRGSKQHAPREPRRARARRPARPSGSAWRRSDKQQRISGLKRRGGAHRRRRRDARSAF